MLYILSKFSDQPRMLTRSATGLLLTSDPTHTIFVPQWYLYTAGEPPGHWVPHSWHNTKSWGVVQQYEPVTYDPAADSDPLIRIIPPGNMDLPFNAAQAANVQAKITGSDLDVTVVAGMTRRDTLSAMAVALGQTAAMWGLDL